MTQTHLLGPQIKYSSVHNPAFFFLAFFLFLFPSWMLRWVEKMLMRVAPLVHQWA